jgi:hypothetical protein
MTGLASIASTISDWGAADISEISSYYSKQTRKGRGEKGIDRGRCVAHEGLGKWIRLFIGGVVAAAPVCKSGKSISIQLSSQGTEEQKNWPVLGADAVKRDR